MFQIVKLNVNSSVISLKHSLKWGFFSISNAQLCFLLLDNWGFVSSKESTTLVKNLYNHKTASIFITNTLNCLNSSLFSQNRTLEERNALNRKKTSAALVNCLIAPTCESLGTAWICFQNWAKFFPLFFIRLKC